MSAWKRAVIWGGLTALMFVVLGWAAERRENRAPEAAGSTEALPPPPFVSEVVKPATLVLPKPVFIGTPKDVKTSNLEVRNPGEKQTLLAPDGCVNLAKGKPVTASDEEPIIGDLKMVTDGNKEGGDGNSVELGPGTQWVQIDLGQEAEVYGVVVWHYFAQKYRAYYDVAVRTADDPDFTQNVRTHFNNDHDNSSGLGIGKDKDYLELFEGRIIETKGVKTRYVRLYSNGNTSNEMNQYIEVEVWGRPTKDIQSSAPAILEKMGPQPIVAPRPLSS